MVLSVAEGEARYPNFPCSRSPNCGLFFSSRSCLHFVHPIYPAIHLVLMMVVPVMSKMAAANTIKNDAGMRWLDNHQLQSLPRA